MDRGLYASVLKEQVKSATGCTEPVAVALAAAKAGSLAGGKLEKLNVTASQGLFKNAFAVGLPGIREKGIELAAAIGYIVADPVQGMQVLEAADEKQLEMARELVKRKLVGVNCTMGDDRLYVDVKAVTEKDNVRVVISGSHDRFVRIVKNDKSILESVDDSEEEKNLEKMRSASMSSIIAYARNVPLSQIEWLYEGVKMNMEISRLGLEEDYGLRIGKGIEMLVEKGVLCNDLLNRIRMKVAAAGDARMGGAKLPVMTSCGSGNQGILIVIPLAVYCSYYNRKREDLLRALVLAHLVNAFAKSYLGKLSPLCGCSVSAGLGTAAALTWLADPDVERIEGAVKGMLSNLTGTICDGAKETCALKLETAAVEAFTYAMLATQDVFVREAQGIVEKNCDMSIKNLEKIGRQGMHSLDKSVLDILMHRKNEE